MLCIFVLVFVLLYCFSCLWFFCCCNKEFLLLLFCFLFLVTGLFSSSVNRLYKDEIKFDANIQIGCKVILSTDTLYNTKKEVIYTLWRHCTWLHKKHRYLFFFLTQNMLWKKIDIKNQTSKSTCYWFFMWNFFRTFFFLYLDVKKIILINLLTKCLKINYITFNVPECTILQYDSRVVSIFPCLRWYRGN